MPISGLAITLSDNEPQAAATLKALASHPAITLGPQMGRRVPVVVETAGSHEDQAVWQWIHDLPGVQFVDVACVHFDDTHQAAHHGADLAEGSQQ